MFLSISKINTSGELTHKMHFHKVNLIKICFSAAIQYSFNTISLLRTLKPCTDALKRPR